MSVRESDTPISDACLLRLVNNALDKFDGRQLQLHTTGDSWRALVLIRYHSVAQKMIRDGWKPRNLSEVERQQDKPCAEGHGPSPAAAIAALTSITWKP